MSEQVINLRGVDVYQTQNLILSDVNLEINKGEFVYLVGTTGSGKSSLLKTLYAELPLVKGEAVVAGYELENIEYKDIPFLRRKLGIIFQDFQLLTDRTIEENLMFVLKATEWKNKADMLERVMEVLEQVGMHSKLKKYPHELSGGEQQRIVIARALLNDPEIIIADEPTGNLDPMISAELVCLLKRISISGTAILMATHDHYIISRYPERIIKCELGHLVDNSNVSL